MSHYSWLGKIDFSQKLPENNCWFLKKAIFIVSGFTCVHQFYKTGMTYDFKFMHLHISWHKFMWLLKKYECIKLKKTLKSVRTKFCNFIFTIKLSKLTIFDTPGSIIYKHSSFRCNNRSLTINIAPQNFPLKYFFNTYIYSV